MLVSHAYPLTGRPSEPLAEVTGVATLGLVGVQMFFAISGYLVATSWLADPQAGRFAARRLLRILPALAVVVATTALVLGPLVTSRSPGAYFGDAETWRYLSGALTYPIRYHLPGVFPANPVAGVVNGSLWTLPFEMLMYLGIVVLGTCGLLRRIGWLAALLAAVCGASAVAWRLGETHDVVVADIDVRYLLTFAIAFVAGTVLAIARTRVPRSWLVATIALAACALLLHRPWLRIWLPLAVAYATIVFGERPIEPIWRIGSRNDVSYGLYLYAYPVQQLLVASGVTSVIGLVATSVPIATACAFASWRLIEAPALRRKPARPPVASRDAEPLAVGQPAESLAH